MNKSKRNSHQEGASMSFVNRNRMFHYSVPSTKKQESNTTGTNNADK
jgi:hypothetical protein